MIPLHLDIGLAKVEEHAIKGVNESSSLDDVQVMHKGFYWDQYLYKRGKLWLVHITMQFCLSLKYPWNPCHDKKCGWIDYKTQQLRKYMKLDVF